MERSELLVVYGGGVSNVLNGTFFNAVSRCLETIMEAGRILGTALRYMKGGKVC